jgi:hypothetical protein
LEELSVYRIDWYAADSIFGKFKGELAVSSIDLIAETWHLTICAPSTSRKSGPPPPPPPPPPSAKN